jgi:hypothetical protein
MKKIFLIIALLPGICGWGQAPYPTAPPAPVNIIAIDYAVNSGGNGNIVSAGTFPGLVPAADINGFAGNVPVSGLPQGFHRVYLRARDASGIPGHFNNVFFDNYTVPLYATPPPPANIIAIDYVVNNGGNMSGGGVLPGLVPAADINAFASTVPVAGLPSGFHRLYLRSRDASGLPGHHNSVFFDNYTVPVYATSSAPSNITAIETFIDNFGGFGTGTPLTGFTPAPDINALAGSVSMAGVNEGFHRIFLRSKDDGNRWSHPYDRFFDNYTVPLYSTAPAPAVNIVAAEYCIDANIPFGSATPIPITPGIDIAGLSANLNVTGLVPGVHRVYIRCKDANGRWSLTNFSIFDNSAISPYPAAAPAAPAIGQMEYYIDNDPGFGNATGITVPGNTGDVSGYAVNLSVSGSLTEGLHYLCIRSRQNPWSLTNIIPFVVGTVTPVSWLYIRAQLQDRNGFLQWGTAEERNTSHFVVEHSTDGRNFAPLTTIAAAGNSTTAKYYQFTHTDILPGLHYYRIRQVDRDGSFSYSPTVTLLRRSGLQQVVMAPNPAVNYTLLVLDKPARKAMVQLYSAAGSLLQRIVLTDGLTQQQLDLTRFAKGTYTVHLINDGVTTILPLVKQ